MSSRVALVALIAAVAGYAAPQYADALHVPEHTKPGVCKVGVSGEPFSTLQSAIDDPMCTTVHGRPMTFREQLLITRSLTLAGTDLSHGDEQFLTTIKPPDTMTAPYALVRIVGRKVKVRIKHIAFEGPATGPGLIGIRAEKDTILTIRNTIFQNLQPSPLTGSGDFVAIHSGVPTGAQITKATITDNRFIGFQSAGLILEGPGTTALIESNILDAGDAREADDSPSAGIIVRNGAAATITRNDILDNQRPGGGGFGILVENGAIGAVKVLYNNIDRNDTGIAISSTLRPNLYRNALDQNGDGVVFGDTGAVISGVVSRNRIEGGTGIAVRIDAGQDNSIYKNEMLSNLGGGAYAGAGTSLNVFSANRADLNGGLGFDDDSTGTKTAKTANTYSKNNCSGNNGGGAQSTPAGLCR
jgi:hypothetical protein